jgi:hypothetical protein
VNLYTAALEHGRFDPDETQRLRVARADALAEAGRGPHAAEGYLGAMRHVAGEARTRSNTVLLSPRRTSCWPPPALQSELLGADKPVVEVHG